LGAWEMLEGATLNGSVWRAGNAQVDAARRGERETVVDLREAFVAYVRTYQRLEQDMLDEWSHCESIVRRARARSAESAERQAERMQHSGAASAMARSAPEKHSDSLPVDSKAESAPEPA